jgi:phosphate transport system permease protein
LLLASAAVAILTTIGVVLSLIGETLLFMDTINWRADKFFFGSHWMPLAHARAVPPYIDENTVGWLPLLAGTMMITGVAMAVALPIGLMAAIYLSDYATVRIRSIAKPVLEILAGIPTVVYGFFAAITVAPFIREAGEAFGMDVSGQSALAAGVVMGLMIIPFISSLSDDVINAVPQSLRDGSMGVGATRAETMRFVILPAALPGIISAVILGVSRAVGETMIVVMAASQGPNLTANPLETMTTVTVQIVMLIIGDTEASLSRGPAFTLGFALFTFTLILNIVALQIVRRFRAKYD